MSRSPRATLTAALLAGLLGGCGPLGGSAPQNPSFGPIAEAIARGEDRVRVRDLAAWIIKDRADLLLIDVRAPADFQADHIRTAVSLPLPRLLAPEGLAGLPRDRMLLLYADGTAEAAQAAVLLRVAGLDAYALEGGYGQWIRYTTNPEGAAEPDEDAQTRAERRAVACYFAGDYAATAGLPVRNASAAFTPEVTPVAGRPGEQGDPLGLGLDLGLGPDQGDAAPPQETDPLGLGPGAESSPAPSPGGAPRKGGLLIGEGC